ncbi:hypothetical protein RUND412_009427 [Rhizina undulata]
MEDSPLTIAHQQATLARSLISTSPAVPETLIAAANAYALAASSFSSAATLTKDPEALRTLSLLANEHERQALRLKAASAASEPRDTADEEATEKTKESEKDQIPKDEKEKDREKEPLTPPVAGTSLLRKSIPSLATNLASARGIPQRSGISSSSSRRRELKISTIPENSAPIIEQERVEPERKEEQFSKFYSGLNTILSRISSSASSAASLAFAGLPLGVEDVDEETERAALAGLLPKGWADQRGRNMLHNWNDGGESFYVVPSSGGTMSYAGIVRGEDPEDEKEKEKEKSLRRSRTYPSESSSPSNPRDGRTLQLTGHAKTKEELVLENTGLRQTIDHMSRTMQTWQRKTRESENMLKNSIIALSKHPGPSSSSGNQQPLDILSQVVQRKSWMHVSYSGEEAEDISEGRQVGEMEWEREKEREREDYVARLEEEIERLKKERDEFGRENDKLRNTIVKYNQKWERLKEGARNKRGGGSGNGGGNGTGGSERSIRLGRVDEGD